MTLIAVTYNAFCSLEFDKSCLACRTIVNHGSCALCAIFTAWQACLLKLTIKCFCGAFCETDSFCLIKEESAVHATRTANWFSITKTISCTIFASFCSGRSVKLECWNWTKFPTTTIGYCIVLLKIIVKDCSCYTTLTVLINKWGCTVSAMFVATEIIIICFIISDTRLFCINIYTFGISPACTVTYPSRERTIRMALEILTMVSNISIVLFIAKHVLYWIAKLNRSCRNSFLVMMPCYSLNINIWKWVLGIIGMIV